MSKLFKKRVDCPFTGMWYDVDVVEFIEKWLKTPHIRDSRGNDYEFVDFLDEMMETIPAIYRRDEDHTQSDEFVKEELCNKDDVWYYIDGKEVEFFVSTTK